MRQGRAIKSALSSVPKKSRDVAQKAFQTAKERGKHALESVQRMKIQSGYTTLPPYSVNEKDQSLIMAAAELSLAAYPKFRELLPNYSAVICQQRSDGVVFVIGTFEDSLVLSFKGSTDTNDAIINIKIHCKDEYHAGMYSGLEPDLEYVRKEVHKYAIRSSAAPFSRVILTGHSLGGGYASILYDLIMTEKFPPLISTNKTSDMSLITFGAPWVRQQKAESDLIPKHLLPHRARVKHFVNDNDIVPRLLGHSQFSVVPQSVQILPLLVQNKLISDRKKRAIESDADDQTKGGVSLRRKYISKDDCFGPMGPVIFIDSVDMESVGVVIRSQHNSLDSEQFYRAMKYDRSIYKHSAALGRKSPILLDHRMLQYCENLQSAFEGKQ